MYNYYANQNQEEYLIEGIMFEMNPIQQIIESEEFMLNNRYGRFNMLNSNPRLPEALDKIKILNTKPDGYMPIQMVANYFEVPINTIKATVNRNQEELFMNGLVVLKGEELKGYLSNDFVSCIMQLTKIRHLTLLNRRVILNIAMLLRDSVIAKAIRYTILNVLDTEEGQFLLQQRVYELEEKLKEKDKEVSNAYNTANIAIKRMCIAENEQRRLQEELDEYRRRELYEVEEEIPEGVPVYYDPRNGYKPTIRIY